MGLIVLKFGGTSVENIEKIEKVAELIRQRQESGNNVLAVISAMGDSTDRLLEFSRKFTDRPDSRELDMLISTGEQQSGALLSIALNSKGVPAISLTGHQIGMITDGKFRNARIIKINHKKITDEFQNGKVVVVAGFQGVNQFEEITTLGRGGSDTTAVALASVLKADICEIYTDVSGVYNLDPGIAASGEKLSILTYDELLDLSYSGAGVIHPRAAELAKKFSVPLSIRSSYKEEEGTIIVQNAEGLDREEVYAITTKGEEVRVILEDVKLSGDFSDFLNNLRKEEITPAHITLETIESNPHITMVIDELVWTRLKPSLESGNFGMEYSNLHVDRDLSTLTVHGIGITVEKGIFNRVLNILVSKGVNVLSVTKAPRKLEFILSVGEIEEAVKEINMEINK